MAIIQRSKLFGLKKLKAMTKGCPQIVVSPHKVYSSADQFRMFHTKNNPRLLVRTDEKGRNYKKYDWSVVPRDDVFLKEKTMRNGYFGVISKKLNELEVRERIDEIANRIFRMHRIIVHPTELRKKVGLVGNVFIDKSGWITLNFSPNSKSNPHFRFQFFKYSTALWIDRTKKPVQIKLSSGDMKRLDHPNVKKILIPLIDFLNKGFKEGQIKMSRDTEISFLTWKEKPNEVEVYDLVEKRLKNDS
jgi:hypothetical protein